MDYGDSAMKRILVPELRNLGVRFLTNAPSDSWIMFGVAVREFHVIHDGQEKILQAVGEELYRKLQKFAPIAGRNLLVQKAGGYHVRPLQTQP